MKSSLRRGLVDMLRAGVRLSGERGRRILCEAISVGDEPLYETIETVVTTRGPIRFYCLGDLPSSRARTLFTKEPETIEWIDGFDAGDTYWDVGANVGIYALYAAIGRKHRVVAFEPSASNYFLLNRNIEINGMSDVLQAVCAAFSDETRLDALNMLSTGFGGALSSFGTPVDPFGARFEPRFRQGMLGYSIDDFMVRFDPPFPNHLKIDVDGIEDRIIVGAERTLADPRLKSLSIELDEDRHEYTAGVVERIGRAGLKLASKRHSDMIEASKYKSIFNWQFRRESP